MSARRSRSDLVRADAAVAFGAPLRPAAACERATTATASLSFTTAARTSPAAKSSRMALMSTGTAATDAAGEAAVTGVRAVAGAAAGAAATTGVGRGEEDIVCVTRGVVVARGSAAAVGLRGDSENASAAGAACAGAGDAAATADGALVSTDCREDGTAAPLAPARGGVNG